jgi:hypothetical protein
MPSPVPAISDSTMHRGHWQDTGTYGVIANYQHMVPYYPSNSPRSVLFTQDYHSRLPYYGYMPGNYQYMAYPFAQPGSGPVTNLLTANPLPSWSWLQQSPLHGNGNPGVASANAFDPFVTTPNPLAAPAGVGPVQANPFSHDTTATALGGAAYFANQSGFQQPVSVTSGPA